MTRPDPPLREFEPLRKRYFDPLCQKLGLEVGELEEGPGFAIIHGTAGSIRVYFEEDRYLFDFTLGPSVDAKPLCSVETIAERFPDPRLLSEGHLRLSLEEQVAFLESRWAELEVMFSGEHLADTRRWHVVLVESGMKKFTREGH